MKNKANSIPDLEFILLIFQKEAIKRQVQKTLWGKCDWTFTYCPVALGLMITFWSWNWRMIFDWYVFVSP